MEKNKLLERNKEEQQKKKKIKKEGGTMETEEKNTEIKFKPINEKEKQEKAQKEMEEPKRKRKWIIPVIIISILLVLGIIFSTIFALINMNQSNIASGVKIEGIDVSGLTIGEARGKLEMIYQEKLEKEISIQYEEYESSINPTLIETKYKVEEAVEKAIEIGKTDNIIANNYTILFALLGRTNIEVDMELNEEVAKQTIEDMGANLPGILIESSYYIEDNNLIVTKGKEGIKVDTELLLEKVKEKLKDISSKENYITIPVESKTPEPIDIDKIHSEIYKEAKDAYYTKDPFTIHPEIEGVDFDVEAAKKLLEEEKEEYVIVLTITKPKVSISQIGEEAFPNQLAVYTTRYDASNRDRSTNLQLACNKINGKVLLAGEVFSYNKTLGERTIATGYKNAKVYENGEVIDGIGGGICQISSTLYNTVLMANLQIVERRNHQFVTSYLPAGRDATVAYGIIDFRFKNTRKYPIKIIASSKNGIASVAIYGIKEAEEYTFSFETKTIASIPTSTRYVEDASLAVGTEKVKQKGANGLKTETYIVKRLNGKVISKNLLSRDTYDAMQKIVLKGTKGASNSGGKNNSNSNISTPSSPEKPSTPKPEETTPPEETSPPQESNTGENQTQKSE